MIRFIGTSTRSSIHKMSSQTISTRFLIISDTHDFEFNSKETARKLHYPVPKADVVLHCGDLTNVGGIPSYKKVLKFLGSFDAELKLIIAGNHDLSLDKEYWRSHNGNQMNPFGDTDPEEHNRAIQIMTGDLAKEAGVTYLVEGTQTFALSNGTKFTIYTSPYTPEFCDWAFAYERHEDRYNTADQVEEGVVSIAENPIPNTGIDIMMTHGPPKNVFDGCPNGNVGCDNLFRAVGRVRPKLHCFGHIHEGHGAKLVTWESKGKNENSIKSEREIPEVYPDSEEVSVKHGEETLMVNAAIQNGRMDPYNAPFLLDLELPRVD